MINNAKIAHAGPAAATSARKDGRPTKGDAIRTMLPASAKRKAEAEISDAARQVAARYLTRAETCEVIRCGETKLHELFNSGALRPVRIGRRVLVPVEQVEALLAA